MYNLCLLSVQKVGRESVNKTVKELISGFAIGTANIIPGVSGGTFLLIFGLYERVISALNALSISTIKELGHLKVQWLLHPLQKKYRQAFFAKAHELDLFFIMRLVLGGVGAILILSSLMEYLIAQQFVPTYSYFWGLILASVMVPFKLIKQQKLILILPGLLGVALTLGVATTVNPYDKTMDKSSHYEQRLAQDQATPPLAESSTLPSAKSTNSTSAFSYKGIYTPKEFLMIALAGAIAISAMILPGVSGSLVLLLLGQYLAVLTAISGAKYLQLDQIIFLVTFMGGMLVGILLFVRLINWFFKHHHDGTIGFLTGLILGSLWALWPFKEWITAPHYIKDFQGEIIQISTPILTNINTAPTDTTQLIIALVFIILGVVTMIPFLTDKPSS